MFRFLHGDKPRGTGPQLRKIHCYQLDQFGKIFLVMEIKRYKLDSSRDSATKLTLINGDYHQIPVFQKKKILINVTTLLDVVGEREMTIQNVAFHL